LGLQVTGGGHHLVMTLLRRDLMLVHAAARRGKVHDAQVGERKKAGTSVIQRTVQTTVAIVICDAEG